MFQTVNNHQPEQDVFMLDIMFLMVVHVSKFVVKEFARIEGPMLFRSANPTFPNIPKFRQCHFKLLAWSSTKKFSKFNSSFVRRSLVCVCVCVAPVGRSSCHRQDSFQASYMQGMKLFDEGNWWTVGPFAFDCRIMYSYICLYMVLNGNN